MEQPLWQENLVQRLKEIPGNTSFYYKDLGSGQTVSFNADEPMCAASVIKLTIMAELFRQDLCWLMITISDNMATNMLIDLLGIEKIQANICRLGLKGVELNRKLFEKRPEYRTKTNYITAASIGKLLELIYRGELVSPEASRRMMEMLLAQQCTNKIPLLLPGEGLAAHKTGEDAGITHDVGVLMAQRPCIVCFCNLTLQPGEEGRMNRLIGELTREIWDAQGGLA